MFSGVVIPKACRASTVVWLCWATMALPEEESWLASCAIGWESASVMFGSRYAGFFGCLSGLAMVK